MKNIMINLTSTPHHSHTPYLPHNTKNIAHFGNLHNISYSHTLLVSRIPGIRVWGLLDRQINMALYEGLIYRCK
jgi:hypothetical protein